LEDLADEHVHKDVMITLSTGAKKPNKRKKAPQKKCFIEGCTNQSVSFGRCISHGAKVNKTKCKAMTSPGERCKNYAQKYGLCRRHVNYNTEDVVQILLEGGVIQKTIEPEEPTEKSVVAVKSSIVTSANDMDVNFDLETMIDINVE
jgi:hypothetical protein